MESAEKGFSSSKHPPISSYSGESNENDVNPNAMGSNSKSQNAKKSVVKHFMAPTVSANSKVKVPRKKILGEKNDSFTSGENTQFPKNSPDIDSRNGLHRSGSGTSLGHPISTCSYTFKSDDEDVGTFSSDSSLKPYDPLTNYLSPRPKYLRYKPNRRQEMFFTSKSEGKEDNSFLCTTGISDFHYRAEEQKASEFDQKQVSLSLQESSSEIPTVELELEDDYDSEDTDQEEDEEFEEEKGWSFKGMMKFLFLLALAILSTSYLSAMNDATPSPIVNPFDAVPTNSHNRRNVSGTHVVGNESGFLEVNPFVKEIVKMSEPYNEASDSLLEEISYGEESEKDLIWSDSKISEFEVEENGKEEEEHHQFPAEWESDSNATTDEDIKVEDASKAHHLCGGALDDIQSVSRNIHDTNQDNEGNELENDQEIDTISEEAEIGHEAEEIGGVSAENLLETGWPTMEIRGSDVDVEDFIPAENDGNKSDDASMLKGVMKSMKSVGFMELEAIDLSVIWLSVVFTIMASLVWLHSKWTKKAPELDSLHERSSKKVEPISARPSVKLENKQEKAESIVKPSSAFYSYQETTREYARIQAPDVELLGEFVIEEYSSSLRSCGRKGRIDTEESVNPISYAGHIDASPVASKPQPLVQSSLVGSQTQPVGKVRLLNVSDADSNSYGSFTTEKILLRKETGKDGDAKPITTPVRRSSRIRNLSVAPP
ncbi:OLC1v1014896C1 [Oldenlandia corymbosa var. corymbosa]|uniref:OLC1v1014896C1 n=1 Tax=Oldenlandia corymbosa var. corymbosa TaxID=529605 RepID=A0AAV1E467_OLDCO|nr:OLC1v1014896C1 [Oldenlandia corymbosa var. corymbosa]